MQLYNLTGTINTPTAEIDISEPVLTQHELQIRLGVIITHEHPDATSYVFTIVKCKAETVR